MRCGILHTALLHLRVSDYKSVRWYVVTTTYHDDFILAKNGHTALDNEEEDTLAVVTVLNNNAPDQ